MAQDVDVYEKNEGLQSDSDKKPWLAIEPWNPFQAYLTHEQMVMEFNDDASVEAAAERALEERREYRRMLEQRGALPAKYARGSR